MTKSTGGVSDSSTKTVAGCVCLAFLASWLTPYHTYPYWSFYHDYISLAGVVLGLLIYIARRGRSACDIPRTTLLPLGLALVVLVDALSGRMSAPWDAVIAIGYLVVAAGAMVVGANLVLDERVTVDPFAHFATALVIAGAACVVITFGQYLGIDDRFGSFTVAIAHGGSGPIRPFGNLGQPNQLALTLCWSLAGAWYLFQKGRVAGWLACTIAAFLITSMALTQSKVTWLILPIFMIVAWWLSRRVPLPKTSRRALLTLAAYFVVLVVLLPAISQAIGVRTETLDERMRTNSVRLVMIMQGFYISFQHPLLGVGWNGFGSNQILVASLFGDTEYAMHAHNFISNLAAEEGWPITIAVLIAIVAWGFRAFYRKPISAESGFAMLILAAVAIHSMVEFPLWYAYILMPVAFVVGMTEARLESGEGFGLERRWIVLVALLCAAGMVIVASDYRRLVQSFRALGYERIGWSYSEGSTVEPDWTVFPHFYRYIAFADVRPTLDMSKDEIRNYERVVRRFAYSPVLMRMAMIYALNGRQADALRLMDALRHVYPPRYREAYRAWGVLAVEFPAVLGQVYEKLPPP